MSTKESESNLMLLNQEISQEDLDDVEKFINKMRYRFQVFGMSKDHELYIVRKDEDPWLKFTVKTDGKKIKEIKQCEKRVVCEHDLNPNRWTTVYKRGLF